MTGAPPFILDQWYVAARREELEPRRETDFVICARTVRFSPGDTWVTARDIESDTEIPCRLQEGLIWVFMAGAEHAGACPRLEPPLFNGPKGRVRFMEKVVIPAHQDDAVYGLLDPAHTPFVHRSPIWRGNGILKEKIKCFVPNRYGFTMQAHAPVNSDIYRLIGGQIRVHIDFQLPGLRAEYIRNRRHTVLGLTALTPVDDRHTALRQIFYWDTPVLAILRPFARGIARPFLQQDVAIMALRRQNEIFGGRGMLLGDSDQQFVWYTRLKQAWEACGHVPCDFVNPLEPATLRWQT